MASDALVSSHCYIMTALGGGIDLRIDLKFAGQKWLKGHPDIFMKTIVKTYLTMKT